jgi:hypothetical protein
MKVPRFQFRLRTLMIVVTLFAVTCSYVGRQVRTAMDRHLAVETHEMKEGAPVSNGPDDPIRCVGPRPFAPWPLRWFGEEGYGMIILDLGTPTEESARMIKLFPESSVYIRGEDKPWKPPSHR